MANEMIGKEINPPFIGYVPQDESIVLSPLDPIAGRIKTLRPITQTQYDALVPDPETLYVIVGA